MCQALEILGFNATYHMTSVGNNRRDASMWLDALRAKYDGVGRFGIAEWDQLLGHCQVRH